MSSAIEVLRTMLEIRKKPNLFVSQCCKDPFEDRKIAEANALGEALLALEQKEDDRKQGALEELKRIEEAWHHIGSKGVCNYIEKRIKKLEEESGKK